LPACHHATSLLPGIEVRDDIRYRAAKPPAFAELQADLIRTGNEWADLLAVVQQAKLERSRAGPLNSQRKGGVAGKIAKDLSGRLESKVARESAVCVVDVDAHRAKVAMPSAKDQAGEALKVIRSQSRVLGDPRHQLRAYFVAVMKGKRIVGPAQTLQPCKGRFTA
jgi:hypothetical protein